MALAFYYYEYELSLKREERNGEGENHVGIGITMQNVWRHCVSTTLSEPDGDLILTHCDHPVGSSTGADLAVDVSRMSASTRYASLVRTYLVEVLLNLGVAPPSFRTVLVDKIMRLVASATVPNRGPELPVVEVRVRVVEVCVRAVEYEDEVGRAVGESMEEAASLRKGSPATAEAIERSLEKVRVEAGSTAEQCVVCLEEFEEGEEVTCMPCSHVYHEECIVKWLQTSHMCPLCRFELPKVDSVV